MRIGKRLGCDNVCASPLPIAQENVDGVGNTQAQRHFELDQVFLIGASMAFGAEVQASNAIFGSRNPQIAVDAANNVVFRFDVPLRDGDRVEPPLSHRSWLDIILGCVRGV